MRRRGGSHFSVKCRSIDLGKCSHSSIDGKIGGLKRPQQEIKGKGEIEEHFGRKNDYLP